jgi:predicted amidophosphoribosyltransferase
MGPAKTLLSAINIGRRECIPAAASLMAYQWLELKLLLPEFLIPLPTSFWQKQKMGFDPHLQLAKELGKILAVPVIPILRKKFDRPYFLAQGGFCHRLEAKEKKGGVLCDRRVLLIAPLLDDGLFRSAGNELKAFFPAQIEALAFAAKLD